MLRDLETYGDIANSYRVPLERSNSKGHKMPANISTLLRVFGILL
jgi:hypothetical protein